MKNNFNTAWLTEVLECAQGCFQRKSSSSGHRKTCVCQFIWKDKLYLMYSQLLGVQNTVKADCELKLACLDHIFH